MCSTLRVQRSYFCDQVASVSLGLWAFSCFATAVMRWIVCPDSNRHPYCCVGRGRFHGTTEDASGTREGDEPWEGAELQAGVQ